MSDELDRKIGHAITTAGAVSFWVYYVYIIFIGIIIAPITLINMVFGWLSLEIQYLMWVLAVLGTAYLFVIATKKQTWLRW